MPDRPIDPVRCPRCHVRASNATRIEPAPIQRDPRPGDIAICPRCGSINRFNSDLTLREMTEAEIELVRDSPKFARMRRDAAKRN